MDTAKAIKKRAENTREYPLFLPGFADHILVGREYSQGYSELMPGTW